MITKNIKKINKTFLLSLISILIFSLFLTQVFALTEQEKLTKAYHPASEVDFSGGLGMNLSVSGKLYVDTLCMKDKCENYSGVLYPPSLPDPCPGVKVPVYEYFNGPNIPEGFSSDYPITSEYYDTEDQVIGLVEITNINPADYTDTCNGDKEKAYVPVHTCGVQETSISTPCVDIQHIQNGVPVGTGAVLVDINEDTVDPTSEGEIVQVSYTSDVPAQDEEAARIAADEAATTEAYYASQADELQELKLEKKYVFALNALNAGQITQEDFDVISQRIVNEYEITVGSNTPPETLASQGRTLPSYKINNLGIIQAVFDNVVTEKLKGIVAIGIINSLDYTTILNGDTKMTKEQFEAQMNAIIELHKQDSSEIIAVPNNNVYLVDNSDPNLVYGYSKDKQYVGPTDDFEALYTSFKNSVDYSLMRADVVSVLTGTTRDGRVLNAEESGAFADEMIKNALWNDYFNPTVVSKTLDLVYDSYWDGVTITYNNGNRQIAPENSDPGLSDYYQKVSVTKSCAKRARIKCVNL
jgi:hypothetical protein